MDNKFATTDLPEKRTGGPIAWIDRQNMWKMLLLGISLYLFVVLGCSLVEYAFHVNGRSLVVDGNGKGAELSDLLYFNFITILTVGYGDFHPVSYGKFFSVIEAFVGVGLFSMLVALITVKALLPPRNSIVFSKYAYYCTEPEFFLIIFVNTSQHNLANCQMSSYFKLGGDWRVRPSITSPFITQSVQTFYIDHTDKQEIISNLRDGDSLRIGLVGSLAFTSFSTSIQYHANEILVIANRDELVAYDGFWKPDFTSPSFREMFHYQPEGAPTLDSYVNQARAL